MKIKGIVFISLVILVLGINISLSAQDINEKNTADKGSLYINKILGISQADFTIITDKKINLNLKSYSRKNKDLRINCVIGIHSIDFFATSNKSAYLPATEETGLNYLIRYQIISEKKIGNLFINFRPKLGIFIPEDTRISFKDRIQLLSGLKISVGTYFFNRNIETFVNFNVLDTYYKKYANSAWDNSIDNYSFTGETAVRKKVNHFYFEYKFNFTNKRYDDKKYIFLNKLNTVKNRAGLSYTAGDFSLSFRTETRNTNGNNIDEKENIFSVNSSYGVWSVGCMKLIDNINNRDKEIVVINREFKHNWTGEFFIGPEKFYGIGFSNSGIKRKPEDYFRMNNNDPLNYIYNYPDVNSFSELENKIDNPLKAAMYLRSNITASVSSVDKSSEQVYIEKNGDCDEQSALSAYLLANRGYESYLLAYYAKGSSVGHSFNLVKDKNNGKWYVIEFGKIMEINTDSDNLTMIAVQSLKQTRWEWNDWYSVKLLKINDKDQVPSSLPGIIEFNRDDAAVSQLLENIDNNIKYNKQTGVELYIKDMFESD